MTAIPPASNQPEIRDFEGLIRALRGLWHGHFLFRGEDSVGYTLRSKFGRFAAKDKENTPAVEKALIESFRRYAHPHCSVPPRSEWEWMALAQHHGLATRLLDWTDNALIAAYFATRSIVFPTRKRVIYVLDAKSLPAMVETTSPFEIQKVVTYRPHHFDRRIISQAGVLTAHPDPASEFASPALQKWVIHEDAAFDIFLTLSTFGIDEAFVFPDLDGISRQLNHDYIRGHLGVT